MNENLKRRLQGFGLLAGIAGAIASVGAFAAMPVMDAREAMLDAQRQIERFEQTLARDHTAQLVDTSQIVHAADPQAVSLTVQRALVDLVRSSGLVQLQLATLSPQKFERGIARQPFKLQLSGDLDQVMEFMKGLSRQQPMIFVDSLSFVVGSAHRGDIAMRIDIEASAYARDGSVTP